MSILSKNKQNLSSIETLQIIWNVWSKPENLLKFSNFPDFFLVVQNKIYKNNISNIAIEHVVVNLF